MAGCINETERANILNDPVSSLLLKNWINIFQFQQTILFYYLEKWSSQLGRNMLTGSVSFTTLNINRNATNVERNAATSVVNKYRGAGSKQVGINPMRGQTAVQQPAPVHYHQPHLLRALASAQALKSNNTLFNVKKTKIALNAASFVMEITSKIKIDEKCKIHFLVKQSTQCTIH